MFRVSQVMLAIGMMCLAPEIGTAADFTLVNSSGFTIDQLYVVPCWGQHWGTNQLSGYPVVHSRSYTVTNLEPGCYDLMVILPIANECTIAGAVIRKHSSWVVTRTTVSQATLNACSGTEHFVAVGGRPWVP
jgi:hypothetical protein